MSNTLNVDYVKRALCFHGPPMQKIWESERGDLPTLGISTQPNYEIYQARQRYFTFQERAKRLKLHQFFAKKADALYDTELQKYANVADESHMEKVKPFYAVLPPYELFAINSNEKLSRPQQPVLERIKNGDVVYGVVKKMLPQGPITVKLLCSAEPLVRFLSHLSLKASVLQNDVGPLPIEADGSARGYHINDYICCEVLRILVDADRVYVGMAGVPINPKIKFGLIKREDLPLYFRKAEENSTQRYEEFLTKSRETLNPNYDVLFSINGLDVNGSFTLMNSLNQPFPEEELAINLRKSQASKWAFRAVAEGIERFKRGMHMEAFQCLNKALAIDPENVEGLVARGALFANRGSFQKAVDDFKTALEINKFHGNARKYMGETLVALGRSLEDEKRFEEAGKAYMHCLEIIPQHAQALECLERLNQRTSSIGGAGLLDNELLEHLMNLAGPMSSTSADNTNLQTTKTANHNSSSEDSSSDSEESNSDVEIVNVSTSNKGPMLSPLSKRMALHAASLQAAAAPKPLPPSAIQYDQPFYYNLSQPTVGPTDFKLEDDDTATRVRKLLEEASQHKKAKKKKSKNKKSKKSKKDIDSGQFQMENLGDSLFQNNYLQEAFKTVGSGDINQKINHDISSYEVKIAEIKSRQAKLRDSLAGDLNNIKTQQNAQRSVPDDSPPPPPSMKLPKTISFTAKNSKKSESSWKESGSSQQRSTSNRQDSNTSVSKAIAEAQRLSFQIRRPVKTDIFGMMRIASPLAEETRSRSRSPNKRDRRDERSSRRSESRGSDHRRRQHSRSRSRGRRGRSSRSRSRGRDRRRSRSRARSKTRSSSRRDRRRRSSKSRGRRRSHSRSRSRSRDNRKRSSSRSKSVWKRLGYKPAGATPPDKTINKLWKPDELDDKKEAVNNDDSITIEEIDEIINQAQKDRKAEIIKRDKDILKNPSKSRF